jgi:hypothetical protein
MSAADPDPAFGRTPLVVRTIAQAALELLIAPAEVAVRMF